MGTDIHQEDYDLPPATNSTLGGVIIGDFLSVNNGLVSVDTDTLIKKIEGSLNTNMIDLLDGNEVITFAAANEIKQCPVNCLLSITSSGAGGYPEISGDGSTYVKLTLTGNGGYYPLKKGTFVKGNTNVMLLPCSKYTKNSWYFDADSGVTTWLPPSTGKYNIIMSGGQGGDASATQNFGVYSATSTTTGGSGRQISFTLNITTVGVLNFAIGSNGTKAIKSSTYPYAWSCEASGTDGDDTTFAGIKVGGGTGAWAKAKTDGTSLSKEGTDGTTPDPGYDTTGIVSGVEIVGDISSSTSSKGFVSITKLDS